MDTTYQPESEDAMCCPICKMNTTYHPNNEEDFSCITVEKTPHKEDASEEVDQDGSEPKLLSLFPVTPDLQPSKQESATTFAPAEDTTAEQIAAQPRELVTGGLLLHIDYRPSKDYRPSRRLPADWQVDVASFYVNESIAPYVDVMLRCQCNLCNEILARIWWLSRR